MAETPASIQHRVAGTNTDQSHQNDSRSHPLEPLIASLTARTKRSKQIAERNRRVLADPWSMVGFHPLIKEIFYPLILARSSGSRVWDTDGNEYLDFTM